IGHRNRPNELIMKDPALLRDAAAAYADLPGGHSEGYDDTHKQVFKRFYKKIVDPSVSIEYPTFADGLHGMRLLEKVIESSQKRAWVDTKFSAAGAFASTYGPSGISAIAAPSGKSDVSAAMASSASS